MRFAAAPVVIPSRNALFFCTGIIPCDTIPGSVEGERRERNEEIVRVELRVLSRSVSFSG
jgi:hypothetical protein